MKMMKMMKMMEIMEIMEIMEMTEMMKIMKMNIRCIFDVYLTCIWRVLCVGGKGVVF